MSTDNRRSADLSLVREIFVASASQAIALRQSAPGAQAMAVRSTGIPFDTILGQALEAAAAFAKLSAQVQQEGMETYVSKLPG